MAGFIYEFTKAMCWLFLVVIPLLHLTSLLVLWVVPVTGRVQRLSYLAAEVMIAWSMVEVFIVALIITVMEIQQIVHNFANKCNILLEQVNSEIVSPLHEWFPETVQRIDEVQRTDDSDHLKCITMNNSLLSGCWLLFGAALYVIVLREFMAYQLHLAIRTRGYYPSKEYNRCFAEDERELDERCWDKTSEWIVFMSI